MRTTLPYIHSQTGLAHTITRRYHIFCKHRKGRVGWVQVPVCGNSESNTVAEPDLISVCWTFCWSNFAFSQHRNDMVTCFWHIWSFSPYLFGTVNVFVLMSLSAGRGHTREGSSLLLPRGTWRTSWRSGTLFTPADPACWVYGCISPLFLVLCCRGGHITKRRESCNPDYSTSLKLPGPKHGLRLNSQHTCLQQTNSQRAGLPEQNGEPVT